MKHLCDHCKNTWYANCIARHFNKTDIDPDCSAIYHCEFFILTGVHNKPCGTCKSLQAPFMERNCDKCFNDKNEWTGAGYEQARD